MGEHHIGPIGYARSKGKKTTFFFKRADFEVVANSSPIILALVVADKNELGDQISAVIQSSVENFMHI